MQDAIAGVPDIMRNYEPLCDLLLQFEHGIAVGPDEEPPDYRRELDLAAGVARVSYSLGGVNYRERQTSVTGAA